MGKKKQRRGIPIQPNFENLSDDDDDDGGPPRKGKKVGGGGGGEADAANDAEESADEGVEDDVELDDRYESLPSRRDVGVGRTPMIIGGTDGRTIGVRDEEEGAYVLP